MNKKIKIFFVAICWLPLFVCGILYLSILVIYSNISNIKNLTNQSYIPFKDISNLLYYDYFRPQWQGSSACTEYDNELIYKPRIGKASFNSPEFNTTITFTSEGFRKQEKSKTCSVRKKILILGDSHSMGWGVNDDETFSSILNREYGWNTSNAACSSYETVREILYSLKINALQTSDVILFAYCNNDAPANHEIIKTGNLRKVPTNADDWWRGPGSYHQQEISLKGVYSALKSLYLSEKNIYQFLLKLKNTKYVFGSIQDVGVTSAESAEDFLLILKSFPELNNKKIYVFEINGKNAVPVTLHRLSKLNNIEPISGLIEIKLQPNDFFLFDDHLNSVGHKSVAGQINKFLISRKLDEQAD